MEIFTCFERIFFGFSWKVWDRSWIHRQRRALYWLRQIFQTSFKCDFSVTQKTFNIRSTVHDKYRQININFGKRLRFFWEGCWLQIIISGSDRWLWINGWSIHTQKIQIDTQKIQITQHLEKICIIATLSPTDPKWTILMSKLNLQIWSLATNCLSHEKFVTN